MFKYKLGHALNRLSFYYSGIGHRGGTEELSVDESRRKAIEVVEEAIDIFQQVSYVLAVTYYLTSISQLKEEEEDSPKTYVRYEGAHSL